MKGDVGALLSLGHWGVGRIGGGIWQHGRLRIGKGGWNAGDKKVSVGGSLPSQ
jgi:hypothetical protein